MLRHVIAAAEATHRPPVAEVYKIKEKEELVERKRGAAAPVAAVPKKAVVTSMYLHVQTSNDEAKTFWEGHGFKVTVSLCLFPALRSLPPSIADAPLTLSSIYAGYGARLLSQDRAERCVDHGKRHCCRLIIHDLPSHFAFLRPSRSHSAMTLMRC